MKQLTRILRDQFILDNLHRELDKIELDGKTQVVISNVGSKSARQNGLYWLWCTDIANSGMGSHDTKDMVHLFIKQKWVLPILRRDDEFFSDLYDIYKQLYSKDLDKMTWFAQHHVSTSGLSVSQFAEVLTDIQRFYSGHGVPLSDPDDKRLLEWRK